MATVAGQKSCEANLVFVLVDPARHLMRLVTWNVNSLTARLPRVTGWIEEHHPDVVCLQETKQADDQFSHRDLLCGSGYTTAHHGDGRWNGVAIADRVGLGGVGVTGIRCQRRRSRLSDRGR